MEPIPYNKPFLCGNDIKYIRDAVKSGKISGNGMFTQKCQRYFEDKYHYGKCLMTSSCTDALEMAAILSGVKEGDEVILPAYTFVSTALAFARQNATLVFADSRADNPNIDAAEIERLITSKTKVIVVVHYAGFVCEMKRICQIAKDHNIMLIEDAAQAFDSFYDGKAAGCFGTMATFSFHETKNIIAGEGGMLVVNDPKLYSRAEIIWEKGTNRADFSRGKVNKYQWVDIGSSFLPSELTSAFLYAQIEKSGQIQLKRIKLWNLYYKLLKPFEDKGYIALPFHQPEATGNGHIFYIVCKNSKQRKKIADYLGEKQILAVTHYLGLHKSPYFKDSYKGTPLKNCDKYEDTLLRLPLYYELRLEDVKYICNTIGDILDYLNIK